MRVLEVKWSQALSLVCEVALSLDIIRDLILVSSLKVLPSKHKLGAILLFTLVTWNKSWFSRAKSGRKSVYIRVRV